MEEIRRRLEGIESGVRIKFNMECNPLRRSNGKEDETSREGGGELTIYDLLFADDSVFFNLEDMGKSMRGATIVNKVMEAFGQKVSFAKTKVLIVESKRKKNEDIVVIEEERGDFLMDGNSIEIVEDFKYLGTEAETDGNLKKELKKRVGCMHGNFKKFEEVTFQNKYLRMKKKLEMFVCAVVPAGLYNCSCWNLNSKQLRKMNSTARGLLTRVFRFHWRNRVSYDYMIKLARSIGSPMIPMHLMIQRQRLKLFGHMLRMPDDRDIKKLLFGEIEGTRFRGRPNVQWIDNIVEDMKTFNISERPKEDWPRIKELALDRKKWLSFMEEEGMEKAVEQWMEKNRRRRKNRMIREDKTPVECGIIGGIEEFKRSQVWRSPLEEVPYTTEPNLVKKVGKIVAKEMFVDYSDIQRGEEVKLDPYKKWIVPVVKIWIHELRNEKEESLIWWKKRDYIDRRKEERRKLIEKWMPGSNEWNENDGRNEGFEIRDIRGYRKRGNRREYLVEYEPRVLEADIEFPEELPAVNGRPWDLVDWVTTTELGRRIGKDIVLRKRMEWYRLMNEIKKRVVGAQGVVVGEDVGGILEG